MPEIFSDYDLELCLGPALSRFAAPRNGPVATNASQLVRLAHRPSEVDDKNSTSLHPSRVAALISDEDDEQFWLRIHLGLSTKQGVPFVQIDSDGGSVSFRRRGGEESSSAGHVHHKTGLILSSALALNGGPALRIQTCRITPFTTTLNLQRTTECPRLSVALFPFQEGRNFELPDPATAQHFAFNTDCLNPVY